MGGTGGSSAAAAIPGARHLRRSNHDRGTDESDAFTLRNWIIPPTMYSLYRAWFEESSYPRLMETLSPPDTVLRVGNDAEYHFVAHRGVLAAHSGYLKALLAAETQDSSSSSSTTTVVSITVPPTIGSYCLFVCLFVPREALLFYPHNPSDHQQVERHSRRCSITCTRAVWR